MNTVPFYGVIKMSVLLFFLSLVYMYIEGNGNSVFAEIGGARRWHLIWFIIMGRKLMCWRFELLVLVNAHLNESIFNLQLWPHFGTI